MLGRFLARRLAMLVAIRPLLTEFPSASGVGLDLSEAAAALARQREEIAMPPSAVAAAVGYPIAQPAGIDISEIVVRPTIQS